ncbi:sec-independent protein translocase (tatc) [Halogeometricum borinquense DSM 11551]|uniref:Sec-independent protein translocase (Tatc) n=2 Tax=Halogeometricum borinquense TaxID=60847 RepID=E4NPB6_HALBP|nr:twin-arginine translocase subunit TatC [Halogeometricum borinquense]ADQ66471.1 Sec-independent protein translocase protein (TatC) [Halogeometricum borinquense DSM 11551]ELY31190.1 sec-independent protein translocase (tatc) [Halogeometricum borinquense DSM 11551]RYJ14337.1 preprotein translocase subunit TatC [Halogeometricum borinquense]
MPSELYPADGFDGTGDGPVGATVRRNLRPLLAVFLLVSAVVTAAASGINLTDVVSWSGVPPRLSPTPLTDFRLALEVGTLSGVFAAGLTLVGLLGRDARVSPSRSRRHAVVAAFAFTVGVAVGVILLPAVAEAVSRVTATSAAGLDVYWYTEVWLFFPVALGGAAATPFLLIAAVRAGVVGRFTSTRQRGYAALAFVVFAACYSPADSATFVLLAAPLFVGLAAGIAWLEFR